MKLKAILVFIGAAALAAVSCGQGFGRGMFGGGGAMGGPSFLLRRDDVKRDLSLSEEQKTKLTDLQTGLRQRFMDVFQSTGDDPEARTKAFQGLMKSVDDDVNKILTADQQKRLREIFIQVSGSSVASRPEFQKDLNLNDDQKSKIADLVKRQQAANGEIFQKVGSGEVQREDVPVLMEKNQKVLNDEIDKILTKDQKDKLATMSGKKFVADPPPSGGR